MRRSLLALLLACGCGYDPLTIPDGAEDSAVPSDAPRGDDLPARSDGAPADQAVPDLAGPGDGGADLAAPADGGADLATDDAPPPCQGGYLNGGACPLGCDPAVTSVPEEPPFHVDYCTPVQYMHNPPTSGMHWPWHPEWGASDQVIQREYWVHSLEHGGIILLYNCPPPQNNYVPRYDGGVDPVPYECDGGVPAPPNSCMKDLMDLHKLLQAQKPDKFGIVRVLLTPDPQLPKKFGAVAWNWSYLSDVVDPKVLQCFIDARYGFGPEDAP